MILKAGNISATELLEIDANKVTAVTIENSLEKEKAEIIKRMLQLNEDIGVVFVLDPSVNERPESVANLEIISTIGDIKHIAILAFGSQTLTDLEILDGLSGLESFRLQGNYKKNIDLSPLAGAIGIKELELEYGVSGTQQEKFVSNLTQLQGLKASIIDLAKISLNEELERLTITDTLRSPELLASLLPNLRSFSINKAKGINTFDFIAPLKLLGSLQIGHTNKLTSTPKMEEPLALRSLHLVNTKQFDDIESIFQFGNLEEFKITEPTKITVSEFSRLKEITALKKVYAVFQTEPEDETFRQIAADNGWQF